MSYKIFYLLVSLAAILVILMGGVYPGQAQAGDPFSLIDAVNNLRAANGLPAYQENSILMSIAQAQTDYQAAIGQCTHTGVGGTSPKQRAENAGYGGGGTFFLSENFVCGTNLSVEAAISGWLQDSPHTQTMLGSSYVDVGAGVSVSGDFVYYTLDVAYVAGSGNYTPPDTITPGGPTAIPYFAVQTATPMPDGSIVHIVQPGQNLILIAKAYGVLVLEIKDLNNLTSDNIYVGDKLIIRKASTPGPTSTATATGTPTRAATPTHKPTRTPTPSITPQMTSTEALLAQAVAQTGSRNGTDLIGNVLVIAIIVLAAGGMILMLAGSLLKRRPKHEED
jgi:LysM repeat protein